MSSVRGVQVDTLPGGRIVISNTDPSAAAPGRVPSLEEELRIGSLDDSCSAFGNALSLTVDNAGRIYVADAQADDIRVFSPEGECLRVFGGAGGGPGEFAMLAGIVWQEPDLLWSMDALHNRLTVFDSRGDVLATHQLGPSRGASLPWPLWSDARGNLHVYNHGERRIDTYAGGPGLTVAGAFPIPEVEVEFYSRTYEAGGSRFQAESPIPHSPSTEFTVDREGEVWLANDATFDLHEVSYAGDTLRTVRLLRPAPRLEGRERDSLVAVTGLDERRLPDHKTVLEDVSVGADGWIWVTSADGAIEAWDVFDADGVYRGVVVPPVLIEPRPFPVFGSGTITGVTKGALDVEYVVRLRVVR
ncbi:6-bladed beta-propeller [Candidatus Palauibacter sp.]|uniref:6-bladed beta-propeller n=1 Tax=Candidatus Palauibacter sp. TaxID=3101350 RepID=UPI003B013AC0